MRSSPTSPPWPSARWHDVIGWIAVLLLPGVVGVVTERADWCPDRIVAAVQLLLPWWGGLALVVTVVGLVAAEVWLVVAGAIVVVGVAVVTGPKLLRGRRARPSSPSETRFSVGLANLYVDNEEPDAAARQLLEAAPTILVLTELTPDLLDAFDAAGGSDCYPHRLHREPLEGEYEAGIFSVHAFAAAKVHTEGDLRVVDATVALPDGEVRVVAVHPEAPTSHDGFRTWRRQLRALRGLLAQAEPATIALGDFNAGTLQPPYEALLHTPFRDAHDLMGQALAPSWGTGPSLPRWVPALVARLDHLLVGPSISVIEIRNLDAVGSDHQPFVADLALLDA